MGNRLQLFAGSAGCLASVSQQRLFDLDEEASNEACQVGDASCDQVNDAGEECCYGCDHFGGPSSGSVGLRAFPDAHLDKRSVEDFVTGRRGNIETGVINKELFNRSWLPGC